MDASRNGNSLAHHMRSRAFLALAAVVGVAIPMALAGAVEDCNSDDMSLRLSGCTRLLEGDALADTDRALALILRSDAHSKKGDFDAAISDLNEAHRLAPEDHDLTDRLAIAYSLRSDKRLAQSDLTGAIGDLEQAMALNSSASDLAGRLAKLHQARSLQLRDHGDFAGAIDELAPAINLVSRLADQRQGSVLYALRAELRAKVGKNGEAISDYSRALNLTPKDSALLLRRGELLLKSGQVDLAIADFSRILEVDPSNVPALLWRSNAQEASGSEALMGEARKGYETVLALDPSNVIAKGALLRLKNSATPNAESEIPSRELIRDLQKQLRRVGCYWADIDGKWGTDTQDALNAFARGKGLPTVGTNPTENMLQDITEGDSTVCTGMIVGNEGTPNAVRDANTAVHDCCQSYWANECIKSAPVLNAKNRPDMCTEVGRKEWCDWWAVSPTRYTQIGCRAKSPLEGPDLIKSIQTKLASTDCYDGQVDGLWGNDTRSALRKFAEANEIDEGAVAKFELPDVLILLDGHEARCTTRSRASFAAKVDREIECCIRYHRGLCKSGRWSNGKKLPPNFRRSYCESANRRECRRLVTDLQGIYCQ